MATGSEILLDELKNHGINTIFGVPGRESEMISFNEVEGINFLLMAHEFNAGMAAYGFSEITGKPAVAFTTIGPGVANLANAIYTAYADRVSTIFIAAQVEQEKLFYGMTHQCIDAVSMFESVTSYAKEVSSLSELAPTLSHAINIAQEDPKGPVLLSIPINLLKEEAPEGFKSLPIIDHENKNRIQVVNQSKNFHSLPSECTLNLSKVIEIIKQSKQTFVFAGKRVIQTQTYNLVKELCESYNFPLMNSYDAKGILSNNHQLNYFTYSTYAEKILGVPICDQLKEKADVILAFGYDHKDEIMAPLGANHFISFSGIMPQETTKNCFHVEGEMKSLLEELLTKLKISNFENKNISDLPSLKEPMENKLSLSDSQEKKVSIVQTIKALNEMKPRESVVISDVGEFRPFFAAFLKVDLPNHFFSSIGSSSFGIGLPLGIGVQIGNSTQKTVVVAGDGGFNSMIGDLWTVAERHLNVIIMVLNNVENGLIGIYQRRGKKYQNHSAFKRNQPVSFTEIAKGYGVQSIKTTTPNDLKKALKEAFSHKNPVVIEVPVFYPNEFQIRLAGEKEEENSSLLYSKS